MLLFRRFTNCRRGCRGGLLTRRTTAGVSWKVESSREKRGEGGKRGDKGGLLDLKCKWIPHQGERERCWLTERDSQS